MSDSGAVSLTGDTRRKIIKENKHLTKDALRVIAVAYKKYADNNEPELIFA